jgi:hypothetical protein
MIAHRIGDVTGFVRRHWAICGLLALATVVRTLIIIAYRPAFWFYGDSGSYLSRSLSPGLDPYEANGLGYTVALRVFRWTGSVQSVAIAQHLVGLALGFVIYLLLCRRGLPKWLACLAAVPVLFDATELTLEHYVLGETLFTILLTAAVLLLLWPRTPGAVTCALSGFLVVMSWFTRPSTVPVVVVIVVYLIVRRAGWRQVAAFSLAFLVPYLAVQAWIGERPSAYGASYANRAFYSRVAGFVDCGRLQLSAEERNLCPTEPLGRRHDRPDWYGWNGPALQVPREHNDILRTFAIKAVAGQPGDYVRTVLRELAPHFVPGTRLGPEQECLREKWTIPEAIPHAPVETACAPALARSGWQSPYADPAHAPGASALSKALADYSSVVRFQPWLVTLAILLTLAAALTYRRGQRNGDVRDAVLLASITLTLLIPPVLVAMYDARYGLPALPFASVAAALAAQHLLRLRKPRHEVVIDA